MGKGIKSVRFLRIALAVCQGNFSLLFHLNHECLEKVNPTKLFGELVEHPACLQSYLREQHQ